MKNIKTVLLCLVLLVGFAACMGSATEKAEKTNVSSFVKIKSVRDMPILISLKSGPLVELKPGQTITVKRADMQTQVIVDLLKDKQAVIVK